MVHKEIDEIEAISVTDLPVDRMPSETLPTLCPSVKQFDCSNTNMKSWAQIKTAIEGTNINQLTVSRLKLETSEHVVFEGVENLILCNNGYENVDITNISRMFPNVQRLNLKGRVEIKLLLFFCLFDF